MLGSVLLRHLPAVLGLWAGTTLRLSFLPKGLDIGITGYLPLGFLSGWASSYIDPLKKTKQNKKTAHADLASLWGSWKPPWRPGKGRGFGHFWKDR